MPAAKVAITIEEQLLKRIGRLKRGRLARECAKLNRSAEQRMADEGLTEDFAEWPEF